MKQLLLKGKKYLLEIKLSDGTIVADKDERGNDIERHQDEIERIVKDLKESNKSNNMYGGTITVYETIKTYEIKPKEFLVPGTKVKETRLALNLRVEKEIVNQYKF